MSKYLGWFSCGATSAVACKLALDMYGSDNVDLWYIETGASHEDNKRFLKDCEKWYNKKIYTARSLDFDSPLDVAKKELFNTPYGAPCTKYLKRRVRQNIIMPYYTAKNIDPIHILGFEYNIHEVNRALRWREQHTKKCAFPLILKGYDKARCLLELKKADIDLPAMYKLGYNNNNCIGCFKGGIGYWNKIKKDFPETFKKVAELEKQTGHTCLKKNGKQLYLYDITPTMGRHKDLDIPDCGLFCNIETQGLKLKSIEEIIPILTGA